jgi:hypothetical protein
MKISQQIVWLFILAIPIASVSWTVTHEEVFREIREFFVSKVKHGENFFVRKFFYLFTCEYCFSHYVTIIFLFITDYKLLLNDWRGYIISGFALVWVSNLYMSIFFRLRLDIKKEKVEIKSEENNNNKK